MSQPAINAADLETVINQAWENRDNLNARTEGAERAAVEEALALLDSGRVRVAEKTSNGWITHQWLKKPSCSLSV